MIQRISYRGKWRKHAFSGAVFLAPRRRVRIYGITFFGDVFLHLLLHFSPQHFRRRSPDEVYFHGAVFPRWMYVQISRSSGRSTPLATLRVACTPFFLPLAHSLVNLWDSCIVCAAGSIFVRTWLPQDQLKPGRFWHQDTVIKWRWVFEALSR